MTTIGSTLFHLTRETKCFNLDNVFATSLLLTTVWALFLAATQGKRIIRIIVHFSLFGLDPSDRPHVGNFLGCTLANQREGRMLLR